MVEETGRQARLNQYATPAIRVIVINFNAGEALLRCVASVLASRESYNVVVADNQSSDQSCEVLRSRYGSAPSLTILENATNLGFGPAVNACARSALEPYLLILNPDCEIFPDTLHTLREALDQDSGAALAAPKVMDNERRIMRGTLRSLPDPLSVFMTASGLWRLARWFPKLRGIETNAADLPEKAVRADAVSGACMMVRSDVFRQLQGFDEDFKMHFEDLDLMARIKKAGKYCLYVPSAAAIHKAGVSSASRPYWVHRQKHAGMQRYFRKHCFPEYGFSRRLLIGLATWLHFGLTLPLIVFRRISP